MSWFRWIASVAIFACSAGAAIAEEEEQDTAIECWKGSYLAGFTGHAGHVIDRMSIVCARWNADHGRLDRPEAVTRGLIGRSDGGDELDDVLCPRGSAVAGGYSYDYARHDGVEALHHVDFNCRPVGGDGGGLQPHRFGSNSAAEIVFRPAASRQCADGDLATGIQARHGKYIHQWQLICTRAPGSIVLTKPPSPDAFRETMTSKRKGGIVVVGPGAPPPPDSTPPPPVVRLTKTTAPVDVLKEPDGAKYGGEGDFLPGGVLVPVLVEKPGWCQLELKDFPFVAGGKGWVSATFLESCGK